MSAWRRKLIALFPEMRIDIEYCETIYRFYITEVPHMARIHKEGDIEFLRKIYGFSEWCCRQKAFDMWNAAGVCFYEHLFDDGTRSNWEEIIPWLSDYIIKKHLVLWEYRYIPVVKKDKRYQDLFNLLNKRLVSKDKQLSFSHPNVFTTGYIFKI